MKIGICCNLKTAKVPVQGDDSEEEFDSPVTLNAISDVLKSLGHDCFALPESRELPALILETKPDFVFNFAEGRGTSRSREARVPALLEILGIPYSGSDPFTLSIALDKDVAKKVVESAGVPVPRGWVYRGEDAIFAALADATFPMIIKPAWEGSSKGILDAAVVETMGDLRALAQKVFQKYLQPVLIEEFLPGREFTVGVVGNKQNARVIGAMEVHSKSNEKHFVYSLEVKRNYEERVEYSIPPRLEKVDLDQLYEAALKAYHALGCRDLGRLDFRMDSKQQPRFLEANPLPGLNPINSDLVFINRGMGATYETLIKNIFAAALQRGD